MKHTQPNLDFREGNFVSREDYGKFTANEKGGGVIKILESVKEG